MGNYNSLKLIKKQEYIYTPKLSLAIRVKNEILAIDDFWNTIKKQTIFNYLEIVVIDCYSEDGTFEFFKNINCNLYSLDPKEFTFGDSCNLAMHLSSCNYVCFFSGHVKLETDSLLEKVLDFVNLNGNVSGYFRQVINPSIGYSIYDKTFLKYRFPTYRDQNPVLVTINNQSFSNAASLVNRIHWNEIKFENVIASEDYIWAKSVINKQYQIYYFQNMCVQHSHNESYQEIYNRVRINYLARYPDGISKLKTIFIFFKVFVALFLNSGNLISSLKYAYYHSSAYEQKPKFKGK